MSSWLSLKPFKSQEEEEEEEEQDHSSHGSGGGVKEDLSELGKTLTRQLWGVASFLAPPPPSSSPTNPTTSTSSEGGDTFLGIRNDFAEISGSLKSGFSLISTNKAVNEISRLASNLLHFDDEEQNDNKEEEEEEDSGSGRVVVVGVTEEVLEFIREISLQPDCWIDFPLSLNDYGFNLSNAQREHTLTVEQLAPSLEDLRMKLCPSHLKEEHFWMIYFILLHPRLNQHDSELLSTAQIAEARDILLQTVQNRRNAHLQTSKDDDLSLEVNEKEKEVLAKTVNAEHQEDADVDQWLEEDVETDTSFNARNQLGNEQDVSFSDLEDDDSDTLSRRGGASPAQNVQSSSPNDSSGWVQLGENSNPGGGGKKAFQPSSREKDSEGEESNEWLTIDEFDSETA